MNTGDKTVDGHSDGEPTPALATIGELARANGLTLRALRFYEDRGLLTPARRGAVRLYDDDQAARLRLILQGKQLGFTLAEIAAMLKDDPGAGPATFEQALEPCKVQAQLDLLERQRDDLERAIDRLRAAHQRLMGSVPPPAHRAEGVRLAI